MKTSAIDASFVAKLRELDPWEAMRLILNDEHKSVEVKDQCIYFIERIVDITTRCHRA